MSTFGERLHDAMLISGRDFAAIATACNITLHEATRLPQYVECPFLREQLVPLALLLKVKKNWLAYGIGRLMRMRADQSTV